MTHIGHEGFDFNLQDFAGLPLPLYSPLDFEVTRNLIHRSNSYLSNINEGPAEVAKENQCELHTKLHRIEKEMKLSSLVWSLNIFFIKGRSDCLNI